MKIRKEHLVQAERAGVLAAGAAERVWLNLAGQLAEEPAFRAQHLFYYVGAMLMLLPFTVMVASGFLSIGNGALLSVALLIAFVTFVTAARLYKAGRRIAAAAFAVVSLSAIPLAVFSLFRLCGVDFAAEPELGYASFHQDVSSNYLYLEGMTLLAAIAYLRRFRLPFLMLPVAVVLWYFGMDVLSRVLDVGLMESARNWSVLYGLLLMLGAYVVDVRTRYSLADFSFWLWIFGTVTFWTGLSMGDGSELAKLGYAGINFVMLALSVVVRRRVLAVFGGLGLVCYLGHLSLTVFKLDALFPLVTLALGSLVVWFGLKWPKIEATIASSDKAAAAAS